MSEKIPKIGEQMEAKTEEGRVALRRIEACQKMLENIQADRARVLQELSDARNAKDERVVISRELMLRSFDILEKEQRQLLEGFREDYRKAEFSDDNPPSIATH